jgi:hypothetical protein
MKAVQQYPIPKSMQDVRAFLGSCSFYRQLVPHFVGTAKPLTQLTKKDQVWQWTQEFQSAVIHQF